MMKQSSAFDLRPAETQHMKKLACVLIAGIASMPAFAFAQATPPVAATSVPEQQIQLPPFPVTMKKFMGQDRTFGIFPNKVFVAGYNVGAMQRVSAEGKARGGIMTTSLGASAKTELIAEGIDEALLVRVADAAYLDLTTRLQAAGFEVVTLETARASAGFSNLAFNTPSYTTTGENIMVVGPTVTGVRNNWPLAKTEFGAFGSPDLSLTLESLVVMPNLAFNFGWAGGNRSWGNRATVSSGLAFGIDPEYSKMRVFASKRRQFLEGDIIFAMDGNANSEETFATISDTQRSNNTGQVVLGALLGLGVRARSRTTNYAQVDPARYEALALRAALGWNTAFVATLKQRTGR